MFVTYVKYVLPILKKTSNFGDARHPAHHCRQSWQSEAVFAKAPIDCFFKKQKSQFKNLELNFSGSGALAALRLKQELASHWRQTNPVIFTSGSRHAA
jgi:hypothetical protein